MAKFFQGVIDDDGNDAVAADTKIQVGLVKWDDHRSSDEPHFEVYIMKLPNVTSTSWEKRVKTIFDDGEDAQSYFFSLCDALGLITKYDPESFYLYRPRYD